MNVFRTGPVLAVALALFGLAPHGAAQEVYRTLTVQAAPGELLELIELYREERTLLEGIGAAPSMWMRHSQGDFWDLMLMYPIGSLGEYFADDAVRRRAEARSADGRSGEELQRAIDALTAWREEVFVEGPPRDEIARRWADAGLFHVEMFQGLAGKRAELVHQRHIENDYIEAIGGSPNAIFTRVAGASTDVFTIGFYESLQAYAEPSPATQEERERAAIEAGFEGAAYIGTYLRELLLRHHDTLAVAIN